MHGTAQRQGSAGGVRQAARSIAASLWGERGARAGLATRGVVYLVLSYLIARIALGAMGQQRSNTAASGTGVATAVARQPGGHAVLVALAVGLLLYALFSLLDAILHHDRESPAAKRWGDRALSAWGFVVYGTFSGYCFHAALAAGAASKTAGQQDRQDMQWSAQVLRWPAGQLWLAALGAVLLIVAGFLVSRAARRSFRPRLDEVAMGGRAWRTAMVTGVAGYLGRALLFATIGGCILHAALENNPQTGQGVDGSIRILANSAAGPVLLWIIVLTLGLYGAYMFLEARFRHV